MRPSRAPGETVVVAFDDVAGVTTAIPLARLPMRLDEITITPDVHRPMFHLNLEGLDDRPVLRRIVLHLGHEQARIVADKLDTPAAE